jgi:cobalt-zinc-cadmium efflux system membrane fusion protein
VRLDLRAENTGRRAGRLRAWNSAFEKRDVEASVHEHLGARAPHDATTDDRDPHMADLPRAPRVIGPDIRREVGQDVAAAAPPGTLSGQIPRPTLACNLPPRHPLMKLIAYPSILRPARTACFALLLLVSAGTANVGCHKAEAAAYVPPPSEAILTDEQVKKAKVVVEVATDQDLDDTLATSGKVTFEDVKVGHIYSPVSGRVARIDAQLGQRVKKGETLAVIESPDIGQASSDVTKADAALIAAEHDLQREQELLDKHATSYKDFETAEDTYRQAKAEKQRAMQKAYLLRTGEVQGQYSIGGSVQELFTVGELDEVWVMSDIYESDLARVKIGAKAEVAAVAYPNKRFDGKVDWISETLDPTTRTAKVRCSFPNPERLLKQDMYTTVTFSVASHKALALPPSAVLHLGDQTVVFIDRGVTSDGKHRFERVPVTVDDGTGSKWLPVMHGLNVGDRVVAEGAEALNAYL